MRGATLLLALLASAVAEGPREVPLLNVEIVDHDGVATRLVGFHRLSGEDDFQGYLGSGEIEVPYARLRELKVLGPSHPGGRMRAHLTLRSGKEIAATFDEREGDQLLSGFATFGRVRIFFRDLRQLKILSKTKREDLPVFGPPAAGVDVRLRDRQGVETELLHFRRVGSGENTLPGLRGASAVAVPLRIVQRFALAPAERAPMQATITLRDGASLQMKLPAYEEETVYTGEAEFGVFRIRLGRVRELEVHRVTPPLRPLDPLEAAQGWEQEEDQRQR
ncbi:MAG: hypothetical protein ACYTEZ_17335 [Planctomycetota bacterium]|jgi:hypothetical protein